MFKFNHYKPANFCRYIATGFAMLLSMHLSAQYSIADTLSLTIQQAEERFVQKNLTLLAGHFNVDANKALIDQAKLWDNPILITDQNIYAGGKFFSHGKTVNGQPNGQVFIQVQQLIKTAGKRARQVDLATTSAAISELQLQDVMRNLKYQLRSDYYAVAQLLSIQNIYQQELQELNNLLNGMAAQLKAGNIAQKDYLRVQAIVIALQQDITENNRSLSNQQAELKTLLQVSGNTFVKPSDTLDFVTYQTPPLDQLVALAKASNTAYQLQQKQIIYQQQNVAFQKSLKSPDVTVGPEYDAASSYAPNYVGLTVSLPLPLFNKNQGNIKSAEITVKQQQTALQQLEIELGNNVLNAYSKLMFTQNQNNTTQIEFYKNYQRMFGNMMQSYKQRQLGLLEFIDFFDAFKDANIRLRQQQLNLQMAKEELNYQVGTTVIK